MSEPGGGIHDLFDGPHRSLILLIAFIVLSGIGIGAIAFALFGDRGNTQVTQATSPQPTYSAPTATETVTKTTTAKPPLVTQTPTAPTTPSPRATSTATLPTEYSSPAMIIGTCDEGGSCGVRQRSAPYTDAPRLHPNDLRDGAMVTAVCQTVGDSRSSRGVGSSSVWYRLNNGAYVSAVYMTALSSSIPVC